MKRVVIASVRRRWDELSSDLILGEVFSYLHPLFVYQVSRRAAYVQTQIVESRIRRSLQISSKPSDVDRVLYFRRQFIENQLHNVPVDLGYGTYMGPRQLFLAGMRSLDPYQVLFGFAKVVQHQISVGKDLTLQFERTCRNLYHSLGHRVARIIVRRDRREIERLIWFIRTIAPLYGIFPTIARSVGYSTVIRMAGEPDMSTMITYPEWLLELLSLAIAAVPLTTTPSVHSSSTMPPSPVPDRSCYRVWSKVWPLSQLVFSVSQTLPLIQASQESAKLYCRCEHPPSFEEPLFATSLVLSLAGRIGEVETLCHFDPPGRQRIDRRTPSLKLSNRPLKDLRYPTTDELEPKGASKTRGKRKKEIEERWYPVQLGHCIVHQILHPTEERSHVYRSIGENDEESDYPYAVPLFKRFWLSSVSQSLRERSDQWSRRWLERGALSPSGGVPDLFKVSSIVPHVVCATNQLMTISNRPDDSYWIKEAIGSRSLHGLLSTIGEEQLRMRMQSINGTIIDTMSPHQLLRYIRSGEIDIDALFQLMLASPLRIVPGGGNRDFGYRDAESIRGDIKMLKVLAMLDSVDLFEHWFPLLFPQLKGRQSEWIPSTDYPVRRQSLRFDTGHVSSSETFLQGTALKEQLVCQILLTYRSYRIIQHLKERGKIDSKRVCDEMTRMMGTTTLLSNEEMTEDVGISRFSVIVACGSLKGKM